MVVLGLTETSALAAPSDRLQTFLNPTPAVDDWFGYSVAAVGNNVLVGVPLKDRGARLDNAGAAYLFDASTGDLLQTFLDPTPALSDLFGNSVAAVGNNVLVGVPGEDRGALNAGAAYLFDASTGDLLQTFLNPTPALSDRFGNSVAAVGNNVLVGAPREYDSGAAYLFDASTGDLLQTFVNPTLAPRDWFGYSVTTVGNNVLVGAPWDETGGRVAGAAYLFDASTGDLLQKFPNPTPDGHDRFGHSVAAVGNNVLVGAPYDNMGVPRAGHPGVAYLFDASTGDLLQTLLNPAPYARHDYFGYSVAAVGNNVLVGAPRADWDFFDPGVAYLFDASTGDLLQTFMNPTNPRGSRDQFGHSVAAVGNNVLIGAFSDDRGARNAGAAYLFNAVPLPSSAWMGLSLLGGLAVVGVLHRICEKRPEQLH